jgi:hypothetical protein
MSLVAPISTPTTLYYRLDPGEPGLLHRAPASRATSSVAAQEGRNLRRLVGEARAQGRIVVSAGIEFQRGLEGITPVVRAGRTTVTSVPDRVPAVAAVPPSPPDETASPEPPPGPAEAGPVEDQDAGPEADGGSRELAELRREEARLVREAEEEPPDGEEGTSRGPEGGAVDRLEQVRLEIRRLLLRGSLQRSEGPPAPRLELLA